MSVKCGNCGHEMGGSVYRGVTLPNHICQRCGFGTTGPYGEQTHFARRLERVERMVCHMQAYQSSDLAARLSIECRKRDENYRVEETVLRCAVAQIDALDRWAAKGGEE